MGNLQKQSFSLTPQSLDEAMRFADILSQSDIVPNDFKGNPGNILVAIQWGLELGLQPMQAMQNIAVINGRPTLWGDAVIGIVRSSPVCEYIYETFDEERKAAICRVKRRGEEEQVRSFSWEDARRAGLSERKGPWQQHPKRMMQMRARAFALRDVFPDVLRGMPIAEEVRDTEFDTGKAEQVERQAIEAKQLPEYSDEMFEKNLPRFGAVIESGRQTAEQVVSMVKAKYSLTDEQERRILELDTVEVENADT